MKSVIAFFVLSLFILPTNAQKQTIAEMKTAIEQSKNPPLYIKDVLKKKFILDTVTITSTTHFMGTIDSLAYFGKVGKVYGPYAKGKVLVQILAKAPNTFNHVGQIFLDTSVYMKKFADSLARVIISKVKSGTATFEDMAQIYSMGGEAVSKGDIGWVAAGAMLPPIEKELVKRSKGDIFTVWSKNGLHIIRKTDTKKDDGFVLMMRIFL
jgi:hypothetical protein